MKKIEHPKYVSYEHLDSAGETALFYGFTPLALPHIHPNDSSDAKKISEGEIVVDCDDHAEGATVRLEEKIALIRLYEREKLASQSQPLMFYYKKPFVGDRRKPPTKESHHGLEIIGTSKSIAEALLIQASLAILRDAGETELRVEINSIGDKESLARFTREITAYYRRFMNDLPAKCRETFKKDVFSLLGCTQHESCKKLALECPKSINFLSEKSRQHFKEVLEYLEVLEIPYDMNNTLVSNRDYCGETIFEIRGAGSTHPKAIGIRYDTLAKRLEHKKELPAVGVSLVLNKKAKGELVKQSTVEKLLRPQICFMQLGTEAKLKSLALIESLRQARIPVMHSLAKDKMAGQVGMAEKSQAPIVIIMGKKEAMEGTAIVREAATRSQDSVPLDQVPARLKKYKI